MRSLSQFPFRILASGARAGVAALFLALGLLGAAEPARAGTTHVAVAVNFTEAAKEIAAAFKAATSHEVILSFGASGALHAQIKQGAPFDVFLSADPDRPAKLVEEGYAPADTRVTYAIGKLVLWSRDKALVTGRETLTKGAFSTLSIANPAAAPYGAAALDVVRALGIDADVKPKIVMGNSIAQAFQFVETGNAEIGLIALSQLVGRTDGSRWLVPQNLYSEIRQDAVLLKRGAGNEASKAFIGFLRSPEGRAIVEKYGYGLGTASGS